MVTRSWPLSPGTVGTGRVITKSMNQPPRHPWTVTGRRSHSERRGRDRRVLLVGLAISAVLHLVVITLVSDWLNPDSRRPPRPAPATIAEPPRGMRAVEMSIEPAARDLDVPELPEPDEREDPQERDDPAPRVVATAEAAADSAPADSLTAADRLAVRVVDPRLWEPMILIPRAPTIEDVEARIGAAVELLSDSALAEAEAAIRARDWTVEGADGGKWGISPGKLHLGTITLPLPIWFPVDPDALAAEAQWYELDQQLERSRILESFEERVRAIRERRERERAESQKGDNGGG